VYPEAGMTITISLSEEASKELEKRAKNLGITIEELARVEIERFATTISDEEFKRASEYVLKKNAELYRRLA
jgi:hypothetical protein